MAFAIHQHETAARIYVSPHPILLSHLPPHPPVPLDCPRAPALSALLHASIMHWASVLHTVVHMFQRYSPKSSHPHLLSLSPKVCSLHLCLLYCPVYRIVTTIFLNSIHMS